MFPGLSRNGPQTLNLDTLSRAKAVQKTYFLGRHITNFITAPFNNMRTLKFKAQPTNAFFVTVNQMFGSSSQLPTTAERAVALSTVQTTKQCSAVVGSWKEPPNIWLAVAKNAFVRQTRFSHFRVRMLLKGAVTEFKLLSNFFPHGLPEKQFLFFKIFILL